MRRNVDAVFLATGAQRPRRLGVPGEDLPTVRSARDLTAWAGGVPGWDADPFAGCAGAERSRRTVIVGTGNVALDVVRLLALPTADLERTDLVVTSLGYDVEPIDGSPFDDARGAIAHDGGRVRSLPGVYVVGWIKREARGGIGTNRGCAQENVDAYVHDAAVLPRPASAPGAFLTLLRARGLRPTNRRGAVAIDRAELRAGARAERPRVKLTTLEELRASAQTRRWPRRVS